ncbi:MAG: ABC transporter ATP-binding protein [Anaerolineae bacterium]|nr:ABC transporter ATP-binding protein [Anaerolineae bacterium]
MTHDERERPVVAQTAQTLLLEVRDLTKYFPAGGVFNRRQVRALEGVSFDVARGEVLALVGESGSGKTTTIRLIARLMAPTRGEIRFKGENVLETEPRRASLRYRKEVQMIFQDPFGSLNPAHNVMHHLARSLAIHGKAKGQQDTLNQVHELLQTVGLTPVEEIAQKHPHQLSGGQRQRVAIARALAVDPELMLADEPISMLDVSIRMGVLNLIERLKDERGIAYVYITHDLASARYIGDRIIVMYAGRMVEGALSDDLIREPAHPYTRLLLSAVPNPHAGLVRQKVETKEGAARLPDVGCPFAPRCNHVLPICRATMPEITALTPTHWMACHLHSTSSQ